MVTKGESITFTCSATAVPVPLITWSRLTYNNKSEQLTVSRGNVVVEGNMLTLNDVQYYQDTGNYSCTATNRQGISSTTNVLTVFGKFILVHVLVSYVVLHYFVLLRMAYLLDMVRFESVVLKVSRVIRLYFVQVK